MNYGTNGIERKFSVACIILYKYTTFACVVLPAVEFLLFGWYKIIFTGFSPTSNVTLYGLKWLPCCFCKLSYASRRVRWVGHEACVRRIRSVQSVGQKLKGREHLRP